MKSKRLARQLHWMYPVLSGIFLTLIFPPYGVYALIWVALVPLFMVIDQATPVQAFKRGLMCGIIFFLLLAYWIMFVTAVGMVLLIGYLALYVAVFSWAIVFLRKTLKLGFVVTAPVMWCAMEYFRATVMTGFPWDNLGYAFYTDYTLIQLAEYTGVTGLSFIAVLGNVLIYHTAKKLVPHMFRWNRPEKPLRAAVRACVPLACFLATVLGLSFWGQQRAATVAQDVLQILESENDTLTVALIQANIPQDLKWDESARSMIIDQYDRLTRESIRYNPDLIIWPESSLPGFFKYDEQSTYLVYSLIRDTGIPMVVGGNRVEVDGPVYRYFNSSYYVRPGYDNDSKVVLEGTYDKMHLVPYGEYIPNKHILTRLFPRLESIVPFEDFTFGQTLDLFTLDSFKFGVSICYEDIFPELIRLSPKKGADFIVNITNDAWYKRTSAPYQHFYMAVFRAVENRVAYVRCSNTGITGYALPDGSSTIFYGANESPIFEEGVFAVRVPRRVYDQPTFYTQHGELVLYACAVISVLLLCASFVYLLAKFLIERIQKRHV